MGVDYFPRTRGESTLSSPGIIVTIIREMWSLRKDLEGIERVAMTRRVRSRSPTGYAGSGGVPIVLGAPLLPFVNNRRQIPLSKWLPAAAAGGLLVAVVVAGVISGSGNGDAGSSTTASVPAARIGGDHRSRS